MKESFFIYFSYALAPCCIYLMFFYFIRNRVSINKLWGQSLQNKKLSKTALGIKAEKRLGFLWSSFEENDEVHCGITWKIKICNRSFNGIMFQYSYISHFAYKSYSQFVTVFKKRKKNPWILFGKGFSYNFQLFLPQSNCKVNLRILVNCW